MAWPKGMKRQSSSGTASGKTPRQESNVQLREPSTEVSLSPSTTSMSATDTGQDKSWTNLLPSPSGAEITTSPSSTPTKAVISESLIGYVRNAYPLITSEELAELSPLAQEKLRGLSEVRNEPYNETIKQIANYFFGSGSGWCEKTLAEALTFYLEQQC